jgi:AcrR family transcriptional regulator
VVRFSNGRSKEALARARTRAEARRAAILRAASRVFRTVGYNAAGMRDIALAAELSPANLYHYFSGKDEILYYCQDRTLDRLLAAAAQARRSRAPLPARLHTLAVAHVLCLIDYAEGSITHFEVDSLPPRLRRAVVAKRDRYERAVRALFSAGGGRSPGRSRASASRPRAAAAPDAAVAIATRAFLGALNWTAQWFRPDGRLSAAAVAAMVADYAVAGLPRPASSALENAHGQDAPAATARADRTRAERRAGAGRLRAIQDAARNPA